MELSVIKTAIKLLSAEQVELKKQRKTVNFRGIRTINAGEALANHISNRSILRYLYVIQRMTRKNISYDEAFGFLFSNLRQPLYMSESNISRVYERAESVVRNNQQAA